MCERLFCVLQLAAAAEIDEEPVSKAKQSRSEKKARKVIILNLFPCIFLVFLFPYDEKWIPH